MTKEQINKLLRDLDIWPVASLKDQPGMTEFYYYDTDKKEHFYISEKLFEVLRFIFLDFLEFEIDEEHEHFLQLLKQREKEYPAAFNLKEEFLKSMLLNQQKEFDKLFEDAHFSWDRDPVSRVQLFIFDLLSDNNNPCMLIEKIKFEILDSQPIEIAAVKTDLFYSLREIVRPYYESEKMQIIYRIVAIDENKKYLENLLQEYNSSHLNKRPIPVTSNENIPLTPRQIAFLYILEKWSLDTDEIRNEVLNYYAPNKTGKNKSSELYKVYDLYKLLDGKISIDDKASKKILTWELRDIKKIMPFLETKEATKNANDSISIITKIMKLTK